MLALEALKSGSAMKYTPLPDEVLAKIFKDTIGRVTNEGFFDPYSFDAMSTRLTDFRNLAGVCKAWVDPARAVFWADVVVDTAKLELLTQVLDKSAANASYIQRIYLHSLTFRSQGITSHLIPVLRRLPKRLELFQVSRPYFPGVRDTIWEDLADANTEDWTLSVDKLVFNLGPVDGRNCLILGHFRDVSHLHLSLAALNQVASHSSPFTTMQLQSLVLDIDFSEVPENFDPQEIAAAAESLAAALNPACTRLRSFTIHFKHYLKLQTWRLAHVHAFKHLHSIGCSTISTLKIHAISDRLYDSNLFSLKEILAHEGITSFPSLQHLTLDGCGFSTDLLRRMNCSGLETLEVAFSWPPLEGECEKKEVLASLALPELSNMRRLGIRFKDAREEGYRIDHWGGRYTWAVVEKVCITRGIKYQVDFPDENGYRRLPRMLRLAAMKCSPASDKLDSLVSSMASEESARVLAPSWTRKWGTFELAFELQLLEL